MRVNLTGGDTPARSVLASCQRTLNLYSETIDRNTGEPGDITHYPTPGLVLLGTTPNGLPIRGLYKASNGDLYCVAGYEIYWIDSSWVFHDIGQYVTPPTPPSTTPLNEIKFSDNGTSVCLCDGLAGNGVSINMATHATITPLYNPSASDDFTTSSTGWLGSTFLDYSDTYLVANYPGTPSFYLSNSNDVIFDPLQVAQKTAQPDNLVAAIVQHRVIWLIGVLSTEVWFDSGGGAGEGESFPFQIMPGVAMDYGCVAPYSIAKAETSIFWLAQHVNGQVLILQGQGYNVKRISNHAIETAMAGFSTVSDCRAYCYLQEGHSFYVMNFPTADATWVYDISENMWSERCYLDSNGDEHMQLSTMHAFAYNTNVVNDWTSGNLYELSLSAYTDNGASIKRLISFPRMVDSEDGHRVIFKSFQAEMDVGEGSDEAVTPLLALSWSDDKGKTWSNPITQSYGKTGQYNINVKFMRLGISRNRVFRLQFTSDGFTALQGAYVDVMKSTN